LGASHDRRASARCDALKAEDGKFSEPVANAWRRVFLFEPSFAAAIHPLGVKN
jgi:hypothetical protein